LRAHRYTTLWGGAVRSPKGAGCPGDIRLHGPKRSGDLAEGSRRLSSQPISAGHPFTVIIMAWHITELPKKSAYWVVTNWRRLIHCNPSILKGYLSKSWKIEYMF